MVFKIINPIIHHADASSFLGQELSSINVGATNFTGSPLNSAVLIYNPTGATNSHWCYQNTEDIILYKLPEGVNYSDYIFWNDATRTWELGKNSVHIGSNAGRTCLLYTSPSPRD